MTGKVIQYLTVIKVSVMNINCRLHRRKLWEIKPYL